MEIHSNNYYSYQVFVKLLSTMDRRRGLIYQDDPSDCRKYSIPLKGIEELMRKKNNNILGVLLKSKYLVEWFVEVHVHH